MRIVHLAALIAAAGRVAPQSPPDIPKIGRDGDASGVNATPIARPDGQQRQFRRLPGFADPDDAPHAPIRTPHI